MAANVFMQSSRVSLFPLEDVSLSSLVCGDTLQDPYTITQRRRS